MERVPQQHQLADTLRDEAETEVRASVHLTRFTIPPERRAELVEATWSPASSTEVPSGSNWKLLVELEDGDWLEIAITSAGQSSDDTSPCLDLAEGIVGDEDGAVVGCARVDGFPCAPSHEGLLGQSPEISSEPSSGATPTALSGQSPNPELTYSGDAPSSLRPGLRRHAPHDKGASK
jgi:hypothetical protein